MFRYIGLWIGFVAAALHISAVQAGQVEVNIYGQVLPGVHGHVRVADPYRHYQRVIVIEAPRAHQRNWPRYCHHYSACSQPVHFVAVREYPQQRHWHQPKRKKHQHRHHQHCDH